MADNIVPILKYGLAAYNFLRELNDRTVLMDYDFPSNSNKIIFTAIDDRTMHARAFAAVLSLDSRKPKYAIAMDTDITEEYGMPFRNFTVDESKINRFKIIEIICQKESEYRPILDKFHGNHRINQHDLIDYLKIICERYARSSVMQMDCISDEDCIDHVSKTPVDRYGSSSDDVVDAVLWTKFQEWKLTYTIKD